MVGVWYMNTTHKTDEMRNFRVGMKRTRGRYLSVRFANGLFCLWF